jgi:hypothetical protein
MWRGGDGGGRGKGRGGITFSFGVEVSGPLCLLLYALSDQPVLAKTYYFMQKENRQVRYYCIFV